MDPITQQTVLAAAGAAGGDPVYVDDVFSTDAYNGTGSAQTITNGIDLDGEGGLTWIKSRSSGTAHNIIDSERGVSKRLRTNGTDAEVTRTDLITSLNNNGFTLGTDAGGYGVNENNTEYASWTFRKAPGFFDVVTYNGNSTAGRQISHSLGSVPGMIMVKRTDATENWHVYHRSTGATKYLILDADNAEATGSSIWNDTTPTSTNFTVGTNGAVNATGGTYVAYIFAHDDASFGTDSDESIIKCGTYAGTGAEQFIDLGFEPQFLLHKRTEGTSSWTLFDNMRGWSHAQQTRLFAESSEVEATASGALTITSTGFREPGVPTTSTWVYMAIRRSNKPPEAGTDVFAIDSKATSSPSPPGFKSTFPVDFVITKNVDSNSGVEISSRLQQGKGLRADSNSIEQNETNFRYDYSQPSHGFGEFQGASSTTLAWMFKRAPGFMDVVAYTGTGSATTINHNLGVAPQMMWIKNRDDNESWSVYHEDKGADKTMWLNDSGAGITSDRFNNTTPTDSVFSVKTDNAVNSSGDKYITYLFATLPGISKVGSFNGNGAHSSTGQNIDCGFTNGARFILIKRIDDAGHWTLYDSTRGIISGGNSPYLKLDNTEAQATGDNHLGTYAQGFNIREYNYSGGTWIFLAIA